MINKTIKIGQTLRYRYSEGQSAMANYGFMTCKMQNVIKTYDELLKLFEFETVAVDSDLSQARKNELLNKIAKYKAIEDDNVEDMTEEEKLVYNNIKQDYENANIILTRHKQKPGAYIGGELVENYKRSNENQKNRTLITIDCDDFRDLNQNEVLNIINSKLHSINFNFFLHSTATNSINTPKFRVIVPLKTPLSQEIFDGYSHNDKVKNYLTTICDYIFYDCLGFNDEVSFLNKNGKETKKGRRLTPYDPASVDLSHQMQLPIKCYDATNEDYIFINNYKGDNNYFDLEDEVYKARLKEREIKNLEQFKKSKPKSKIKAKSNNNINPNNVGNVDLKTLVEKFNNKYKMADAIEIFLSDKVIPTKDGRYKHIDKTNDGYWLADEDKIVVHYKNNNGMDGNTFNPYDFVRLVKFCDCYNDYNGYTAKLEMEQLIKEIDIDLYNELETESTNWYYSLMRNDKGSIVNSISNYIDMLENDPQLKGLLYVDESKADKMCIKDYDLSHNGKTISKANRFIEPNINNSDYEYIVDRNANIDLIDEKSTKELIHIREYLERKYNISNIRNNDLLSAMISVANKTKINTIRENLLQVCEEVKQEYGEISKEETFKLIEGYLDLLNAEDTPTVNGKQINRIMFRKFYLQVYNKALTPGSHGSYVLAYIGDQGCGKGTSCKDLATVNGSRYHTKQWKNLENTRDGYLLIYDRIICELEEGTGIIGVDPEVVKSVIGDSTIEVRRMGENNWTKMPSITSYMVTLNKDRTKFLSDVENRRFLPIILNGKNGDFKCFTNEHLKYVKKMLGATVNFILKNGNINFYNDHIRFTEEEEIEVNKQRNRFRDRGALEEIIEDIFNKDIPSKFYNGDISKSNKVKLNDMQKELIQDVYETNIIRPFLTMDDIKYELALKGYNNITLNQIKEALRKLGYRDYSNRQRVPGQAAVKIYVNLENVKQSIGFYPSMITRNNKDSIVTLHDECVKLIGSDYIEIYNNQVIEKTIIPVHDIITLTDNLLLQIELRDMKNIDYSLFNIDTEIIEKSKVEKVINISTKTNVQKGTKEDKSVLELQKTSKLFNDLI